MHSEPAHQPGPRQPPETPDLQTQFEALLHEVWTREAQWRAEDRISLAARLLRDDA